MKLFDNRSDAEYLAELHERMKLNGPNGLINTAVPISDPFESKDSITEESRRYTHCIRINFMGIAATTLFDGAREFRQDSVYSEVKELLSNAKRINELGFFIKLRILFLYPFSIAAQTRILAEHSSNRSAIKEPSYDRDYTEIEQVSAEQFNRSAFLIHQTRMLEQIQHLVDENRNRPGWEHDSPNKVAVRFTPHHPAMCCLFVNNTCFYDVYTLAKETRTSLLCSQYYAPVTRIQAGNGSTFSAFEDHFRYLWEMDVTLDCQDATKYVPNRRHTFAVFKPLSTVDFQHKTDRIRRRNKLNQIEDAHAWRSVVRRLLNKYCLDPSPTPARETLFITCSWTIGADGENFPSPDAQCIANCLSDDFTTGSQGLSKKLLEVNILNAPTGKLLSQELYTSLESSTLAIIVVGSDLKIEDGRYVAKPNIYHELGYLMKKLGPERVLVLFEAKTWIPSNYQDYIHAKFQKGKVLLAYQKVFKHVFKAGLFIPSVRDVFIANHDERLKKAVLSCAITTEEYNAAKSKMFDDN